MNYIILLKKGDSDFLQDFVTSLFLLTETTIPDLGSKTRNFLSLHVVANKLPSRFKDML